MTSKSYCLFVLYNILQVLFKLGARHNELKRRNKSIFAGQCHSLPQRLSAMFFEFFSNGASPMGTRSEEKIQKMLILVFEVIMQPVG